MTLTLTQSMTALTINLTSSFQGVGGALPYTYSVEPNGAGGSINAATGIYTSPAIVPAAAQSYDTIMVVDNVGNTATAQILITSYIGLFCDIIQNQMSIPNDHIYFWDQKLFQPTDSNLYVAVSNPFCKPFSSALKYDGTGNSVQNLNMSAVFDIDIISRGPAARDQKELVVMALNSQYSQLQQTANSFFIGTLMYGGRFQNLSMVDGAAIPYRYKISVQVQYTISTTQATPYFDTFATPMVAVNA